jgi:hypothetical protein
MRRTVGWLSWGGIRPLYDDGTVGEPLKSAIDRTRKEITEAFKRGDPIPARMKHK